MAIDIKDKSYVFHAKYIINNRTLPVLTTTHSVVCNKKVLFKKKLGIDICDIFLLMRPPTPPNILKSRLYTLSMRHKIILIAFTKDKISDYLPNLRTKSIEKCPVLQTITGPWKLHVLPVYI